MEYLTIMAAMLSVGVLAIAEKVKVDVIVSKPNNPKISTQYEYAAHVSLSIEADDGTLTHSGWSTHQVSVSCFTAIITDLH